MKTLLCSGTPILRVEEAPLIRSQNHNAINPNINESNLQVNCSLKSTPVAHSSSINRDRFNEDKLLTSIMKNSRESEETLSISKQSSCESQLISFSPRKNPDVNGGKIENTSNHVANSGACNMTATITRNGGNGIRTGVLKKSLSASSTSSTVATRSSSTCMAACTKSNAVAPCPTLVNNKSNGNGTGNFALTKAIQNSNKAGYGRENYCYRYC